MVTVDLLEPTPSKPEQSIALIRDRIMPLYMRFWQDIIQDTYGKPFNPHIQLFLEMWFTNGLRFILAKDGQSPVGFATCILFRPMQYQARVLQVSDFYDARRADVAKALIEYIETLAKMLNCDELWFDQHNITSAAFSSKWMEQAPMGMRRYTRME